MKNILPEKAYEILRWLNWIVLPAIATFIGVMNSAWNWGWPSEAILTTFAAVETLIGTCLGISKVSYDSEETTTK